MSENDSDPFGFPLVVIIVVMFLMYSYNGCEYDTGLRCRAGSTQVCTRYSQAERTCVAFKACP